MGTGAHTPVMTPAATTKGSRSHGARGARPHRRGRATRVGCADWKSRGRVALTHRAPEGALSRGELNGAAGRRPVGRRARRPRRSAPRRGMLRPGFAGVTPWRLAVLDGDGHDRVGPRRWRPLGVSRGLAVEEHLEAACAGTGCGSASPGLRWSRPRRPCLASSSGATWTPSRSRRRAPGCCPRARAVTASASRGLRARR